MHAPVLTHDERSFIAQLLGASRQRVNQKLKGFEREGAVRIEPARLVVLWQSALLAIAAR